MVYMLPEHLRLKIRGHHTRVMSSDLKYVLDTGVKRGAKMLADADQVVSGIWHLGRRPDDPG